MIERINPETLHHNPAFSQVAVVPASAKLVYVGGQNGVNKEGKVVSSDLAEQTVQAIKNVITALEAANASLKDVFKMTIYLAQGQPVLKGFEATRQFPELSEYPPTISVVMTAGFANPDFLIEIEAVAAIQG